MEYSSRDFDKLFMNVFEMGDNEDPFKVFPILHSYTAFKEYKPLKYLPFNKVFKYVVYAFDRNSPFLSITDMIERRVNAAFLAGFTLENGKFNDEIEQMIRCQNFDVNLIIVQYCIVQANDDYLALVAYQETLRSLSQVLINGGDDSEKTKDIIGNINTLRGQILSIKEQLLQTRYDRLLERSLYIFSESGRIGLSPEAYAKKLAKHDEFTRTLIKPTAQ